MELLKSLSESEVNEAKWNFSEDEVKNAAEQLAKAMANTDKAKVEVHDFEYDKGRGAGFELSWDGDKSDGGSYYINADGDVINAALGGTKYGTIKSSQRDFEKGLKAASKVSNESKLNEVNVNAKWWVEVAVRSARVANNLMADMFRNKYKNDGSNVFTFKKEDFALDAMEVFEEQKIEILATSNNLDNFIWNENIDESLVNEGKITRKFQKAAEALQKIQLEMQTIVKQFVKEVNPTKKGKLKYLYLV